MGHPLSQVKTKCRPSTAHWARPVIPFAIGETRRTPPPRVESPCFCSWRRRSCSSGPVPPDCTGPCPSRNGPRRVLRLLPRYSRSANAGCSICPYSLNRLRSSQFNNAGFVRATEWEKPETGSLHVPFYGLYNGDALEKPSTAGRSEGG